MFSDCHGTHFRARAYQSQPDPLLCDGLKGKWKLGCREHEENIFPIPLISSQCPHCQKYPVLTASHLTWAHPQQVNIGYDFMNELHWVKLLILFRQN